MRFLLLYFQLLFFTAVSLTPFTCAATVDAGTAQTITLPETIVRLNGSISGGTGTTLWTRVSGPDKVIFEDATDPRTNAIVPAAGDFVLRLTVTPLDGTTPAFADVTITVQPNPVVISSTSTPLDHLQSRLRPTFKAGHTLLPMTISYGGTGTVLLKELAHNWGFAYPFPAYGSSVREPASYWTEGDPGNTRDSIVDILANPGKLRVAARCGSLYRIFDNYQNSSLGLTPSTWLRWADGSFILNSGNNNPIVSPLATDEDMYKVGRFLGNTLPALEEATSQRIEVFDNEGEYGLWIPGDNDYPDWFGRDPRVMAAYNASGFTSWPRFISHHKARQERQIKLGIFEGLTKGDPLYSWYQEGYGGERGRWAGWSWWMFTYEEYIGSDGTPLVSDISAPETYYDFGNSGWTGVHQQQGVPYDALTVALKAVGGSISLGQKFFKPYVSMGWENSGAPISDPDLYLGMLKMWYAAGAIGTVAGYFDFTDPILSDLRNNRVVGVTPPTHIVQVILHGQAHALFSHLEEFIRKGDLLPGPNTHPYQSFTTPTPAMEFPLEGETAQVTGTFGTATIPTARLLVRKMKDEDRWLLAVWANTGDDRNVTASTVDPKLGSLTLLARRSGSVYTASVQSGGVVELKLIDEDGMQPTKYLFPGTASTDTSASSDASRAEHALLATLEGLLL